MRFGVCLLPVVMAFYRLMRLEQVYKDENPIPSSLVDRATKVANDLGIELPRILIGSNGAMPMVWSFGKSRLFLPADVDQWTADRLNAVLLHEMIHLSRRDTTWFWIASLARAVNWFNPMAWYAVHRLRVECERACDDHVLRMGVEASDYAAILLELAISVRAASGTGSLALAMASKPNVENRILAILDGRTNRCGVTLLRAVGVLATVSIGVAALATVAANSAEKNIAEKSAAANQDEDVPYKYPHCVVEVKNLKSRSLEEAITVFNREAQESPTGRGQPQITEQETLDAIAKSLELNHVAEAAKETLREIARTKTLPPNAYFRRFTRFDDEQQMNGVWWVRLVVEGDAPSVYSVPVRTTQLFARPYTQMERQQKAEQGLTLINRFVSYFEEQPNIHLREALPKEAMDRLIGRFEKGIKEKDLEALKGLFNWQDASDSTREFVTAELRLLLFSEIHSVKIEPKTLNGNLLHWSAYQRYQPNLEAIGYLEVEYYVGQKEVLSLEIGRDGDEFRLVNYVPFEKLNLPKETFAGWSVHGHNERLTDGTLLMTQIISNPGSLISAHLANEEIRQHNFGRTKKNALLAEVQNDDNQYVQGKIVDVVDDGRTVYINLGRADGLRPGVSFGVVDKQIYLISEARPKAKIEVVEVIAGSLHLSRCKVVSIPAAHISTGDSIYSPAWQPGKKIEFALIGNMDIDGNGTDDREEVKRMIAAGGGIVTCDLPPNGKITGELSVETRWLVIGQDFKAIDEWGVVDSKAKSLGISRIYLDKLLVFLRK